MINDKPAYYCTQCLEPKVHHDPRHVRLCPTCHMFALIPMTALEELARTGSTEAARIKIAAHDERKYFLVSMDNFETVVPHTEATNEAGAVVKSTNQLQAWYLKDPTSQGTVEALAYVKILNHDQYVDWLRRGES